MTALRHVPEIGDRATSLGCASPLTYRNWTGTVGGASYGLKRSVAWMPLKPRTPVRGLFLSGQSVLMPGVMGATAAGLLTSGHIVGIDRIWDTVLT